MTYFVAGTKMSMHECDKCGVIFAISLAFEEARRNDHKIFYCPNGHNWYYPQESDKERFKRLLSQAQNCCIAARKEVNALERSCRAYKGHVTRLKSKTNNSIKKEERECT